MPEYVVADSEYTVQLERDVRAGLEVHQYVHAFAPVVYLVGQLAAALLPFARFADGPAHIGYDLLVLLEDGLELLVRQLGVHNVHRLVMAHRFTSPRSV